MNENKVFGLTHEQIKKQLASRDYEVDPQSGFNSIEPTATFLEPCIRGAKKILSDPEKREMFKSVYRR